jgi:DNA repair photolyase
MKSRPTENPPNRFRDVTVTYDEGDGPPPATITLIEDQSRSILSRNDSDDLDFRWSANPYRGCQTACAYCLDGETQILLGDSRTRALKHMQIGDEIYGTTFDGKYRRYVRTIVKAIWTTVKCAYLVELTDGTSIIASSDHRFLTNRGWKHVLGAEQGRYQKPHLTPNQFLLGTGRFATRPVETDSYRRGYLCGVIRGDGHLARRQNGGSTRHNFRLALADLEALWRAKGYLLDLDVETREREFKVAQPHYLPMRAIHASSRSLFERITDLIAWPEPPDLDWHKGFLAGIFDAEGSHSEHVLRISNGDMTIIDRTLHSARRLAFDCVVDTTIREPRNMYNVRIRGGLSEHLRFFHTTGAAITRKWDLENRAVKHSPERRLLRITRLGPRRLYDITTGTGDFIANGIISHNCYARPTHEYLDMGAGTDFDTKIVIKPNAPELLRETFDKPSWKGELVMFSGVTDCYQPIERDLQLTKQCLEVCLEYRNPVSIISKHALIERDVDLIAELAREAGAYLSVSLAWIDAELARKIEPWAASPQRRLKVIETFAKAGVPVGIMMAPIIPGLNDKQIVKVLESARSAGAQYAGWTLLRLPHAVKDVFQDRLRVALPLVADKVMHLVRETRDGKLYDSTYGVRGRGVGKYAETIKALFDTTAKRLGFNEDDEPDPPSRFQRPNRSKQLSLF